MCIGNSIVHAMAFTVINSSLVVYLPSASKDVGSWHDDKVF